MQEHAVPSSVRGPLEREGGERRGREGDGGREGKEESERGREGEMEGIAQSMDCPVQTTDPYFVRAIHRLHSLSINVYRYISISFFKSVQVYGLHKSAS